MGLTRGKPVRCLAVSVRQSRQSSRSQAAPTTGAAWAARGYRLDLDGLRGVAIALVAVFHVWFGKVSGGVDVFLTLSGYFFIASLLKHVLATNAADVAWTKAINPLPRLWRLARRLLPGLLLVLVAITALVALLMPQMRLRQLAAEVRASALYYQNWELANTSQDYAAADAGNSPLQHLWSMSVQGQFFVSMILIVLALGGLLRLAAMVLPVARRREVVIAVVATAVLAGTVASFIWANHRQGIDQPFNYYDTFARAWQPLAGGLLAILLTVAADRGWRIDVPVWLRNTLGILALALIISCGWWIDGVAQYPGALALVPVGATLL